MKKYTIDEIDKLFIKKDYKLLSTTYKNMSQYLEYMCNKHLDVGIQKVSLNSFLINENNCKLCKSISAKNNWSKIHNLSSDSDDEYKNKHFEKDKKDIFDCVGNEYELLDIFKKNNRHILKLKHCICGNVYTVEKNHFIKRNDRCMSDYCKKIRKREIKLKTSDQFNEEVFNLVGDEYVIMSDYIGKDENVIFYHKKCDSTFYKTPHNFLSGQRCPHCSSKISNGEKEVMRILDKNNIKYVFQKSYPDLHGDYGYPLSYDFYLPQYNALIEYQGEYHDGSVGYITKERLEKQQRYDEQKRIYAHDNNIKYIEIWYMDFNNIEDIIVEEL